MGDAVTSQIILDNRQEAVMVFTNISDGTGEAAVKKVDVSALVGSPSRAFIKKIQWVTSGMDVTILEDADTNVTLAVIGSRLAVANSGTLDFFGGQGSSHPWNSAMKVTEASGVTGDIMFTTTGHASGDTYTVVLHLLKQYNL